ncbi:IgGFc-binding protein-like [Styela clava]
MKHNVKILEPTKPCQPNPCLNGGRCTPDGFGGYSCACFRFYSGKNCEIEPIQPCQPNPCLNGGRCTPDGESGYSCACFRLYSGKNCEIEPTKPCQPNPCLNGGRCTPDGFGGYSCACFRLYSGKNCEIEPIQPCQPNPCLNGGRCTPDGESGYSCACFRLYSGKNCEIEPTKPCQPNPCLNGGRCSPDGFGGYSCACLRLYSGKNCEIEPIQPCQPNPCLNGGRCTPDGESGYSCACFRHYSGKNCEIEPTKPCQPNPCLNGGRCTPDGFGGYSCACFRLYSGKNCEIEPTKPCQPNPCLNGGRCSPDGEGGYSCACFRLYSGKNCEIEPTKPCQPNPCLNGGRCTPDGFGGYSCACFRLYSGKNCEIEPTKPCQPNPCLNGGRCSPDGEGGYSCACFRLYSGKICEIEPTKPCQPNPCLNGGKCTPDGFGGYSCACFRLYSGKNCEIEPTKPCQPNPCLNGGRCSPDGEGGYSCACFRLYSGKNCEIEPTKPCQPNPCLNGGRCTPDGFGGYSCACFRLYSGKNCEIEPTKPCQPNPCLNGGRCSPDGEGGYSCACFRLHSGKNCEIEPTKPCQPNPCLNGGKCTPDGFGGYSCACFRLYSGKNCEIEPTKPCQPNPCLNGGRCTPDGESGYSCACFRLYSGKNCEIEPTKPCQPNPCLNGGKCTPDGFGGYSCACFRLYSGKNCEIEPTKPCQPNPCLNGGRCSPDGEGGYSCACFRLYSGKNCEIEPTKPCQPNPCLNGGRCTPDGFGGYSCACFRLYSGKNCEIEPTKPCQPNPCLNGGRCSPDGEGGYSCACFRLYSGKNCEIEPTKPCQPNPCLNGGKCTPDGFGGYSCACFRLYSGKNCEIEPTKPCQPNPCLNGGRCSPDGEGGYSCACFRLYSGKNCEIEPTKPCQPNPCLNGGRCTSDRFGGYSCACFRLYSGKNCEIEPTKPCQPNPCLNGGRCSPDGEGGYSCACFRLYSGKNCEIEPTKPCQPNPCLNGGKCTPDGFGGYSCACFRLYSGKNCEIEPTKPCQPNPCLNGGRCSPDGEGGYSCACFRLYSGKNCEIEPTKPCQPNPCLNGGRCTPDGFGGYSCACFRLYSGKNCEIEPTKPCQPNPCLNGGRCSPDGEGGYSCACFRLYSGKNCEIEPTKPCQPNPCLNGGSCTPDGFGGYSCACFRLYSGKNCEIEPTKPCQPNPCLNGGRCSPDGEGGYSCACFRLYSGKNCEIEPTKPCQPNPCLNGGRCTPDGFGGYSCACFRLYSGKNCEIEPTKPCQPNPCLNGGRCSPDGEGGYSCACFRLYSGKNCEIEPTKPCQPNPCLNGGKCTPDGFGGYSCACFRLYSGKNCEIEPTKPCQPNPCLNGGRCSPDGEGGYSCACFRLYSGKNCEIEPTKPCQPNPCLNGGSCTPDGFGGYSCACFRLYSGKNCEIGICPPTMVYSNCAPSCPRSCLDKYNLPPKACTLECRQACVCQDGMILSDKDSTQCVKPSECPARDVCRAWGDPHYIQFEQSSTYDFMGLCTYLMSETCDLDKSNPRWFSVLAENEKRFNREGVSWVKNTQILLEGGKINITLAKDEKEKFALINGKEVVEATTQTFTLRNSGTSIKVTTDCGVEITYNGNAVIIRVPPAYKNMLCGLCGDYNGDSSDDLKMRDGMMAEDFNEFGDSYQVGECGKKTPPSIDCPKEGDNRWSTNEYCGILLTDEYFLSCANGELHYQSCVFDMCATDGNKDVLQEDLIFATYDCRNPDPDIPSPPCDYRKRFGIAMMSCPEHSSYEGCASACPNTCQNPRASENCPLPDVEDCVCNEGYVREGVRCIQRKDCGCIRDGYYYKAGTGIINEKDNTDCLCMRGNFICDCIDGYSFNDDGTCTKICSPPKEFTTCATQCPRTCDDPMPPTCTKECNLDIQCVCSQDFVQISKDDSTCVRFEDCKQKCKFDSCDENAICSETDDGIECDCLEGYEGDGKTCTIPDKPCEPNPCKNGGRCVPFVGFGDSYICSCPKRFSGNNCENEFICPPGRTYSDCEPCSGTCDEPNLSYLTPATGETPKCSRICRAGDFCSCPDGFIQKSETDITCVAISTCIGTSPKDPCENNPCKNGGLCFVANDEYGCACPRLYTGKNCEIGPEKACDPNPCQNGGECLPAMGDSRFYTCRCTDGFSGKHCEVAKCIAPKVYTNCASACPTSCLDKYNIPRKACPTVCLQGCVCPEGMILLDKDSDECVKSSECPKREVCRAWGDPHYIQFEQSSKYDFMGLCTYVMSESVGFEKSSDRWFAVHVENEERYNRTGVSWVKNARILLSDGSIDIFLSKEGAKFNGKDVTVVNHPRFTLTVNGKAYTVTTDCGVSITFNPNAVIIRVPPSYKDQVRGLCGDYNGDSSDDLTMSNGEVTDSWNEFASSYVVGKCDQNILSPQPKCTEEEKAKWSKNTFCGAITQVSGIFDQCRSLLDIKTYFQNCVFDMCATKGELQVFEQTIETFVEDCISKNVTLCGWREALNLPVKCYAHSTYESCPTICQKSCADRYASTKCVVPMAEDCVCDVGYIKEGDRCILEKDCGCWRNGMYYSKGSRVTDDDEHKTCVCFESIGFTCTCLDGYIRDGRNCRRPTCSDDPCDEDATCSEDDGLIQCKCNQGYQGDGYFCGPLCDDVTQIENGYIVYSGEIESVAGYKATFRCNAGYILNGNAEIICQADGFWSGANPTCEKFECPAGRKYINCEPCEGTCDNPNLSYLVPKPGKVPMCAKICKRGHFCSCPEGFIQKSASNTTCVPISTCINQGGCTAPKVFSECASSCPASCLDKYDVPVRPCPAVCLQGCVCPEGMVLLDKDSDICVKSSECPKREVCRAWGDPHYIQFEQSSKYDFMGLCTYVMSESVGFEKSSDRWFAVHVENEERFNKTGVSWVKNARILLSDGSIDIFLSKEGAKFNGKDVTVVNHPRFTLRVNGKAYTVTTDCGVSITFNPNAVIIRVPPSYKDQVRGLCGDYNGDSSDDLTMSNGEVTDSWNEFASSYVVGKCDHDILSPEPKCTEEERAKWSQNTFCGAITEVSGIFDQCRSLLDIKTYFQNCVFDMCVTKGELEVFEQTIENFVEDCIDKNVTLCGWREALNLPVKCMAHSTYQSCPTNCQNSCADRYASTRCVIPIAEDCICDAGYIKEGDQCILENDCGCWRKGMYYSKGSRVTDDDEHKTCVCSESIGFTCRCSDGYIRDGRNCRRPTCSDDPCDEDATCSEDDGLVQCKCNQGYQGDGYSCGPLCDDVTQIENGYIVYSGEIESVAGYKATFGCNVGYILVGNAEIICQADGFWSGANPTCEKFDCPAGRKYMDCEPCEGTCDNPNLSYLIPKPGVVPICAKICKRGHFCSCPEGFIQKSASDTTCVPISTCINQGKCTAPKVYSDCASACPASCLDKYDIPAKPCPAVCLQGCVCPEGMVLLDKDSDICVKSSECPKREVCRAWGDPHYIQFEQSSKYDFMGLCTYVMSESVGFEKSSDRWFAVHVENEERYNKTGVSWVKNARILLSDGSIDIFLSKEGAKFNGKDVTVVNHPRFTLRVNGKAYTVTTDCGVSITFNPNAVIIRVPPSYKDQVRGLCGDYNGDSSDDLTMSNGEVTDSWNEFATSYVVGKCDYDILSPKPKCTEEERAKWSQNTFCGAITEVSGIFDQCRKLLDIKTYFQNCVFDMCVTKGELEVFEQTIETFVEDCIDKNVTLCGWREALNLPVKCMAHSTYQSCPTTCQNSCADRYASTRCAIPVVVDCICDVGYIKEGDQCILEKDCGCWRKGMYYSKGSRVTDDDEHKTCVCLESIGFTCTCLDGYIRDGRNCRRPTCSDDPCDEDATCSEDDGLVQCKCNQGYQGDGYSCGPLCDDVAEIENGDIEYSGEIESVAGYKASFWCNTGYILVGNAEIICQADGFWSGANPTCEKFQCPAGRKYMDCEPCEGTCDNPNLSYLIPKPGVVPICAKICKRGHFCSCPEGFIQKSASDTTCVPISTCINQGKCTAPKVYSDCASACPASCLDKYDIPAKPCPAVCLQGCVCPDGMVLLDKDSDICIKSSECPKREVCRAWGDPHYIQFEQSSKYDFMGLCTYVMSESVGFEKSSDRWFAVHVENEERFNKTGVSWVKNARILLSDGSIDIFLSKEGAKFNGKDVTVVNHPRFTLRVNGKAYTVTTDCGVSITFNPNAVIIRVPPSYKDQVRGLCGDYNGDSSDDLTMSNGEVTDSWNEFATSYVVGKCDYDILNPEPKCTEEERAKWSQNTFCGAITQVSGIFDQCRSLLDIKTYFQNCVFDMCATKGELQVFDQTIETFVEDCIDKNVTLCGWREALNLPVKCMAHSTYQSCPTTCQNSCADRYASTRCAIPIAEDCICDAGYIKEGDQCILENDCGCWRKGMYYSKGSRVTDDDEHKTCVCLESIGFNCRCVDGYIRDGRNCRRTMCSDDPCDEDATCSEDDGLVQCKCNQGYQGDGYSCGPLCDDVAEIENGFIVYSGEIESTAGYKATFWCNSGHVLVGNAEIICQADGFWSGANPTCEKTFIEDCTAPKVYSDCASACPASCLDKYDIPLKPCPAVCLQGCVCPEGMVLLDKDSDICVKSSECPKREVCRAWGDPHYIQFEQSSKYDFMGLCTYVMSESVEFEKSSDRWFAVHVENEERYNRTGVSWVKNARILLSDGSIDIFLSRDGAKFNDVDVTAVNHPRFTLRFDGRAYTVTTDCGVSITYNPNAVIIKVPSSYKDRVRGLCGDYNGDSSDDLTMSNGEVTDSWNQFASSYVVGKCDHDILSPEPKCTEEDNAKWSGNAYCGALTDVSGFFGKCISVLDTKTYFKSCLFDMCATNGIIQVFEETIITYIEACAEHNITLCGWREALNLPPKNCPDNSIYESCPETCQKMCADPSSSPRCTDYVIEECICHDGYLKEGNKCILSGRCGCWREGIYYSFESKIEDDRNHEICYCSWDGEFDCTCKDGYIKDGNRCRRMRCSDNRCDENASCKRVDGIAQCKCDRGYKGDGFSCNEIPCPLPNKHKVAIISSGDGPYYPGDVLKYKCPPNYKLTSGGSLTCQFGAFWLGPGVECKALCDRVAELQNGQVTYRGKMPLTAGHIAVYKCNEGYVLSGDKERTCGSKGIWTGSDPYCEAICSPPQIYSNCVSSCPQTCDTLGQMDLPCTLQCNRGCKCPDEMVLLSSSSATCVPIQSCPKQRCPLPMKHDVAIISTGDGPYYTGDVIQYVCPSGYNLVGDGTLTCQKGGVWSEEEINCEKIWCGRPNDINNGNALYDEEYFGLGDVVFYECNEGYKLKGVKQRTCQKDGNWSENEPFCEAPGDGCPAPKVYTTCGTACPATCLDEYDIPATGCFLSCNPGCVCPDGMVLLDKDSAECVERKKCPKRGICRAWGDPHYTMFEQSSKYDFMGLCTYTMSESVGYERTSKQWFAVHAENEGRFNRTDVSWVKNVIIQLDNGHVAIVIGKDGFEIKGTKTLQSRSSLYKLRHDGKKYTVTTSFGVGISYNGNAVLIRLPVSYKGKVEGLCGDYNSDPSDDLKMKNGLMAKDFYEFATSYQFGKCKSVKPSDSVPVCSDGDRAKWSVDGKCGAMTSKRGILSECASLIDVQMHVKNCVFDMCATQGQTEVLIQALEEFVADCRDHIDGLCDWRERLRLPLPKCPANSSYRGCATGCPQTCADLESRSDNFRCKQPQIDGCVCNDGFIRDGPNCVSKENCGCYHMGMYFQKGQSWYPPRTSQICECVSTDEVRCKCIDGYKIDYDSMTGEMKCIALSCDDNPCSSNAICTNEDRGFSCQCKPGYQGDGKVCSSICPSDQEPAACVSHCPQTCDMLHSIDCEPGCDPNNFCQCPEGYVHRSTSDRTCVLPYDCPVIDITCPIPNPIEYGNFKLSSNPPKVEDIATYGCQPGFKLVGNDVRYCQEGGIWSGEPPVCDLDSAAFLFDDFF